MDNFNKKTALILVDLQNDFCHPAGMASKRGKNVHGFQDKLESMKSLLEAARVNNIPVIHAISEHSAWTESPSGKERFGRKDQGSDLSYCEPGTWGAEFYHYFTPESKEKIIVKHRYSAFLHTDLDLILRSKSIDHTIIAGAYTNVCIDSTARDAYMRDFFVTIPSDCVVSDNEQLHHYALELLKGTFAEVAHSSKIKKQWKI